MTASVSKRIAVLLFCLFFAIPGETFARPGQVAKVYDGDTFLLQSGETIRILGIDAPEIGRGGEPSGFFAREAREALCRMIAGRVIDWRGSRPDQYGRILARVEIPEGDVAEIMARDGFAWYYPHVDQPMGFGPEILMAQQNAMESGAGMWNKFLQWARGQGPVVANRRSWRFFPADSPDASRISSHNRLRFSGMEEAFLAGYAPARGLGQWPDASEFENGN